MLLFTIIAKVFKFISLEFIMIKRFLVFLLVIASLSSAFSYDVEQFTKYDSVVTILDDNTIQIEKHISIRNVHDSGIIPGQVEFKIFNADSQNPLNIVEYSAKNRYDDDIRSRVVKTNDYTSIVLDIFQPILPGFEYEITLTYILEYESSGIFFKRVEIPLKEDTRVPILDGDVLIEIPEGKSFTYLSYENDNTTIQGNSAAFSLEQDSPNVLTFEYSFIPLKIGSFAGSLIFWALVNVILLVILGFEVKKQLRRLNGDKPKKKRK